jgi:monoamine oxidase
MAMTFNAGVIRAFSTKEFADKSREALIKLLNENMNKAITESQATYILAVFDEGYVNIYSEEQGKERSNLSYPPVPNELATHGGK